MQGQGHNSRSFGETLTAELETVLPDDHKKLFYFVKWHLADYITGTQGMTVEQEGIYIRFLMRLYDRGKPFPDDERFMVTVLGLSSVRVWKRYRDSLVSIGKIIVKNGYLTNSRFEKEKELRAAEMQRQARAAQVRWEQKAHMAEVSAKLRANLAETSSKLSANSDKKLNEINEADEKMHMPPRDESLDSKKEEECANAHLASETKPSERTIKASQAAQMAFDRYNEIARKCGLPIANVLSPTRKQRIIARIKDAGGWSGFEKALAQLEASAFLQGSSDSGFRADFDFICQAKSFGRLLDGGYGNGAHGGQTAESFLAGRKFYDGAL